MSKEIETLKVEDVENSENAVIIDVPDYVYISKKGKLYYPKKTAMADVEIHFDTANQKGYKPSKAYQRFVEKLVEEEKKKSNK